MSTPQEPEEPLEDLEQSTPEPAETDYDADWRAIVENFGDRAALDPEPAPEPLLPRSYEDDYDEETDEDDHGPLRDPEDRFVPPPTPPLPRPAPPRLLAWLGLFGVPTLVLVLVVAGLSLPQWLGLILMGWFVGGFIFLVASMRPEERDGYDDGAVL